MTIPLAVAAGYMLGSIPFSYLAGRISSGVDVRRHGSGNLGATNVLRVAGKKAAAAALIGDILKGAAAVLLVRSLSGGAGEEAAAAVSAVIGHMYPLFLGFKGGKGVATTVGAFFPLSPPALCAVLAVFLVMVVVTKRVSPGSLAAAVLLPLAIAWAGSPRQTVVGAAAAAALIIVKHRGNIRRLLNGTEPPLGKIPA